MLKTKKAHSSFFSRQLLRWHAEDNERRFPWKEGKDPYRTWLSEILLQQTRADHGLPYYLKFVERYPTIHDLAAAPEEEVFRLWQGLGYYNRCKNLIATAKQIVEERQGIFPNTYPELLRLKGVGPYTAAAISSFAFDLPYAVVDGNVFRVLARFFGIFLPIDTSEGKKYFQELAQEVLPLADAAAYNQAIMDFGGLVCTPQRPRCAVCPVAEKCVALDKGLVAALPAKEKKVRVRDRFFHFFWMRAGTEVCIVKRVGKDIWQQLHQLPMVELTAHFEETPTEKTLRAGAKQFERDVFRYKQRLSHQVIHSMFSVVELDQKADFEGEGAWVPVETLKQYPFPKTVLAFFEFYGI